MKKYFIYSAALLALVSSCQSDDFLGNTPGNVETNSAYSAIKFDGNAGKISRATSNSGTPQQMLDYQFKIYGVKKGTDNKYSKVFGDYRIWYATNKTTSNTNNWEYVGSGTITTGDNNSPTTIPLNNAQTIKYWDYASDNYHFVAGSPIDNFTYTTNSDGDITSATVSGLGGHITANEKTSTKFADAPTPVYVAEPVAVKSTDYKEPVKFKFVRHQTKVRVGIYETIPGYSISKIKFYAYDDDSNGLKVSNGNNIILTSGTNKYFSGGKNISGIISYDWSKTSPEYTFSYNNTDLTERKNWYGGAFANGVKANVSNHPNIEELYGTDADMESNGYFTVLPTPSAIKAAAILIKCDYTLTADDNSGETIEVKGATAAIPEAYSRWDTNTLYTYIFKISDNTNGYTGNDPDNVGLYPITFNAVVKEEKFGMQGTITTFTTPSITTCQDGSVGDNSTGIKYVTDKDIKVTVTESTSGEIKTLSKDGTAVGNVAVYKLTKERTEADLQLTSISQTEIAVVHKQTVTLGTDNKSFTFTPTDAGYYAIQYLTTAAVGVTPAAYTYKVVHVAAK